MQDAGSQPERVGRGRVYLDFYQFSEPPFSITPDPDFLFLSVTHSEVLDKVLHGIDTRMGFILLTGEVGTGKTTVCRAILDRLEGKANTVYIINPALSGVELLSTILDDLGVSYSSEASRKHLLDGLNRFLLQDAGQLPVVIIIDDAQTMPLETLEDLRLLTNLETDKQKLLQMVLVGQPELTDTICLPEMRQLRQRVAVHCELSPITGDEVDRYVARRLFVAGNQGRIRFTRHATRKVFRASRGLPRLINKICDLALTAGYVEDATTIERGHVQRALGELGQLDFRAYDTAEEKGPGRRRGFRRGFALLASGVVLGLLISVLVLGWNLFQLERDSGLAAVPSGEPVPARVPTEPEKSPPSFVALPPVPPAAVPLCPFTVQLGSFKTLPRTLKAASQYGEKDIRAHWQWVDFGEKGAWYRLFAGRFQTRAEAKAMKREHGLEKAIVLNAPWTVLASTAASSEELDPVRTVLRDNAYDSYLVTGSDGVHQLMVGAFVERERAERVAEAIATLGGPAKVVPR